MCCLIVLFEVIMLSATLYNHQYIHLLDYITDYYYYILLHIDIYIYNELIKKNLQSTNSKNFKTLKIYRYI